MAGSGVVLFLLLITFTLIFFTFSIHKVEEGHVGVYWRGGALMDRISEPGYHLKMPFLDSFANVQVTLQTDKVENIACGTSGGVLLWIEKVEVVNRLTKELVHETVKNYTIHYDRIWIFDKIHHEINQFCSKHTLHEVYISEFGYIDDRLTQVLQQSCNTWAPGIEIIAIRITKPKIPAQILKNFELMEAEKTKLLIVSEAQKVIEKEAETERKRATIEAEKVAAVSKIRMEQQIMEKQALKEMRTIEDEIYSDHEKALADADFYRITRLAEANQKMLTEEFLQLQMINSVANNTKIYFGHSLPGMFLDFMEKMTPASASSSSSPSHAPSHHSVKP